MRIATLPTLKYTQIAELPSVAIACTQQSSLDANIACDVEEFAPCSTTFMQNLRHLLHQLLVLLQVFARVWRICQFLPLKKLHATNGSNGAHRQNVCSSCYDPQWNRDTTTSSSAPTISSSPNCTTDTAHLSIRSCFVSFQMCA